MTNPRAPKYLRFGSVGRPGPGCQPVGSSHTEPVRSYDWSPFGTHDHGGLTCPAPDLEDDLEGLTSPSSMCLEGSSDRFRAKRRVHGGGP